MSDREKTSNELEFFGRITASVSHEMNNVISIIDQVSGLLEDHLAAAESGMEIKPEQLARVHGKIQAQTARGVEIIRRLNKFAHSVDDPVCDFDLNVVLENLAGICDRFATLNRVVLLREWSPQEIPMTNSPFLVQQAVYYLLRYTFEITDNQAEITISTAIEDAKPCIEIAYPKSTSSDTETPDNNWIEKAQTVCALISCSIEYANVGAETEIIRILFL